jgi:hypothetical protein
MTLTMPLVTPAKSGPVRIEPLTITLNAFPRRIAKQLPRKHSMTRTEYDCANFLGDFAWDAIERGDRGGFLVEIGGQHYILSGDALNASFRPIVPRIILC